eukprot:CAMPEP_0196813134 /NCGR_PEP_ID=MMETSP1362-20130617/34018_1 /TAXON_ID=163516 /ORGANISM="Leptocylindrus danicus, Strain CCMP1856" /LENGTH=54 /DNA_ID=CAMNT_0042189183 /DNA_START=234 /DNA_END=395 /DNA_ORIENTATION=+
MSRGKLDVTEIKWVLEIVPTQGSLAETIPHLQKGTPHCQLSVQVVPSLSPIPQL